MNPFLIRSLTILNDEDEDEEEEDQDKFNGNGFLSIGSDYFSNKEGGGATENNLQEDNSEPYDLRYHHTFASLPIDQSHFSTSQRTKVKCLKYSQKCLQFLSFCTI